ncbi:MAG: shikimate dehydrogenase [Bacteroidaceae bacterium]|nr:shikimate dehydrogenase [Bacteroidaceae bacterium]
MAQRITGHTELIGLIAKPIRHSKSPMMHNTAFEALGLDYAYLVFEVDNQTLEEAVTGLKALGVRGFNVSMPNKSKIMQYLDEILPAGELCQAVNTVVNDNGRLIGTSTDGEGFMMACQDNNMHILGKKITLLGAGGAATAIAMQAGLDGVAEISIFNRDDDFFVRAEENAARLNEKTQCKAKAFRLEDTETLRREIANSAMLVNATSCGFGCQFNESPIPDATFLRKHLMVADVIYSPAETHLLAMAKAVGCPCMNGIGMMLYQGAAAFKMWTGKNMPIEAVKKALSE